MNYKPLLFKQEIVKIQSKKDEWAFILTQSKFNNQYWYEIHFKYYNTLSKQYTYHISRNIKLEVALWLLNYHIQINSETKHFIQTEVAKFKKCRRIKL